jgi:hypothetical protein
MGATKPGCIFLVGVKDASGYDNELRGLRVWEQHVPGCCDCTSSNNYCISSYTVEWMLVLLLFLMLLWCYT